MPFPEDYGTVLPPGVYNAVRIHKIQIKRLPFPYGDCILANSDMSDRDVYTSQYNVTYSKTVSYCVSYNSSSYKLIRETNKQTNKTRLKQ